MPHDTDLAPRTSGHAHHAHGLWRHYAEMVAAMFVGMLVLGTMRDLPMAFTVGAHVVMLVDTPYRSSDGPACVAAHQNRLTACIQSTAGALWEPRRRASVAKLAKSLGVVVIDPIPWMCLNGKCPIVIGNVLVYRDNHHISRTFARLVTPMIEAQLPAFAP